VRLKQVPMSLGNT